MISLGITIESSTLRARDVNKVKNVCNRLGALAIRDQLPDHFKPNAQQRFKYKRRTRKHNERKRQLFGHTTPLVFTGELRRAVLTSARVTATANKGTVFARGSRGTKEQKGSNLRTQYKNEVETLTKKQKRELARDYGKNFAEIAAYPEFQTKKKKKA